MKGVSFAHYWLLGVWWLTIFFQGVDAEQLNLFCSGAPLEVMLRIYVDAITLPYWMSRAQCRFVSFETCLLRQVDINCELEIEGRLMFEGKHGVKTKLARIQIL